MTFYFGGGFKGDSDPGTAFNDAFKKSRLARLVSDGFSAPKEQRGGLLAQMAGIDPNAAMGMEQRYDKLDERAAQQLQDRAKMVYAAWKSGNKQAAEGLYGQTLELAKQVYPGFEAGPLDEATAGMLGQFAGIGTEAEEYTLAPGSARFRGDKLIASQPFAPKGFEGQWDSERGMWIPKPGAMPAQALQMPNFNPQSQNSPAANSAFDQHIKPLMQREGGFVEDDAGAGPTNFGINSRANPDVDVRNLTPDAASNLYKQRYWDAINGDNLPPAFQAGAFDAAVNMGVGKAKELLQASGGDPAKFDQLRLAHYEGLARSNPQKFAQYLPAWRRRVQETSAMGGMNEQYQSSASGAMPAAGGLRAIPVEGVGPKQRFQARQYTPQEVAKIGLPPGTVAYTSEDGTPKVVNKPDSANSGQKPLPVAAMRIDQDIQDALNANAKAADVLAKHARRMQDGELSVSPANAVFGAGRELVGMANENDVNLRELRSDMTAIVNESLRLNKGVQTEGDAQRAYKEIMTSNDPAVVARAIQRLAQFSKIAAEAQVRKRKLLYSNYGRTLAGPQSNAPRGDGGWSIKVKP